MVIVLERCDIVDEVKKVIDVLYDININDVRSIEKACTFAYARLADILIVCKDHINID